jgi:L-threonylcarbamoyladenylate synthase
VETARPKELDLAIRELSSGGVVAFPTETVYGLGADASNPAAIAQIFAIKGRPPDHPLIVHISGADQLSRWSHQVPDAAYVLAEQFWPGPLTLILPDSKAPPEVTGGQSSVGVRAPSHPVAQALLQGFGGGIAAPSANRFGRISPTRASHVRDELGDRVRIILEGGECKVGLESTILSLAGPTPCLLRPGAISRSQLEDTLNLEIHGAEKAPGLRASGLLESHYAPRTALRLIPSDKISSTAATAGPRTVMMCLRDIPIPSSIDRIIMPPNPVDYGVRLYATLRELDQGQYDLILAELPPAEESWAAVHDRLGRASHIPQSSGSKPPVTK